jgi:hypothetical protein
MNTTSSVHGVNKMGHLARDLDREICTQPHTSDSSASHMTIFVDIRYAWPSDIRYNTEMRSIWTVLHK